MKNRLTWGAAIAVGSLIVPATSANAAKGSDVEFTVEVSECNATDFAEVEVNDEDADTYSIASGTFSGEGVGKNGWNHINIEVDTDSSCLLSGDVLVTVDGEEIADPIIDVTAKKNLHVSWFEDVPGAHDLDPLDGGDEDGSDEDGSDEDGSEDSGADENGADDNGLDQDGIDPLEDDGANDDGAGQDAGDDDGDSAASSDSVTLDDSGITVASGGDNAPPAQPVKAQPRNVG